MVAVLAMPEDVRWEARFTGVVGFRVFDERDLLKYWPACSKGWLFQISDGWLPEIEQSSDHVAAGFYGEVHEYFVAGEDTCVSVIASQLPIVVSSSSRNDGHN